MVFIGPEGFVVLHLSLKFPKLVVLGLGAVGFQLFSSSSCFSRFCQFVGLILTHFSTGRAFQDSELLCHFVIPTGFYRNT